MKQQLKLRSGGGGLIMFGKSFYLAWHEQKASATELKAENAALGKYGYP